MRRLGMSIVLVLGLAVPAAPAAARSTVTASPASVAFGQALTIKGVGWPRIEFCRKTVAVALESAQNKFRIGRPRVGDNGRWTLRYVPRRAKVGAGRWRVLAKLQCESGKDGHFIYVTRRSAPIRIRAS
jgi:hypothetical protein